jgi:hypothetical protein
MFAKLFLLSLIVSVVNAYLLDGYNLTPINYSLVSLSNGTGIVEGNTITNLVVGVGSYVRSLQSCSGACYIKFRTSSYNALLGLRPFVAGECETNSSSFDHAVCFNNAASSLWYYSLSRTGAYSTCANWLSYYNVQCGGSARVSSYLIMIIYNDMVYYYNDYNLLFSVASTMPSSTSYSMVSQITGLGSITDIEFGTVIGPTKPPSTISPSTISPSTVVVHSISIPTSTANPVGVVISTNHSVVHIEFRVSVDAYKSLKSAISASLDIEI